MNTQPTLFDQPPPEESDMVPMTPLIAARSPQRVINQITNDIAMRLRDKGIQKVSEGSPSWIERAHQAIPWYPGYEATGEDLRVWVAGRIGEPHHQNVYGAMIMGAVRKGLLTKTGEYRQMKLKQSHARVNPVYSIKKPNGYPLKDMWVKDEADTRP